MQPGSPQMFWERRIQRWDRSRYAGRNPVSWRAQSAARRVSATCEGRVVVDLGCGGGRFLQLLGPSSARLLVGLDFSEKALALARARCSDERYRFYLGDVLRDPLPEGDLYVALGLLDWLHPEHIQLLFNKLKQRDFLFSFSERRPNLWRWLHQVYCWLRFGWNQSGYLPRYYSSGELCEMARQAGYPSPQVESEPALHFGAFLWSYGRPHLL